MVPEFPKILVQGLAGAVKGLRLYPGQHPALTRQIGALRDALQEQLRTESPVKMGLLQDVLFVEEHLFADANPAAEEIARLLKNLDLQGLEFQAGVSSEELRILLELLNGTARQGASFTATLVRQRVRHIQAVHARPEAPTDGETPGKVYQRALQVVDRVFADVRLGQIPASAEAIETVKGMVRITLAEPQALLALSLLKDYDNYTFTHSVNVAVIALATGRACGLDEDRLRLLGLGALLHDLGKLRIDQDIINKPGRLTPREFEEIKRHPRSGAEIVARMEGVGSEVVDIVLGHHLRYDRAGYPADIRGRKLSALADLAAIADTYDAMTTLRAYQRPLTPRQAIEGLKALSGTLLRPEFLQRFIDSLGPWPVGSLVRLGSNELALVKRVDTAAQALELLILFDADAVRLERPLPLTLAGPARQQVVADVDPAGKGIEVGSYFQ